MWHVRQFEKYLIFYHPLADGVQIERVIHAAQDHTRILTRTVKQGRFAKRSSANTATK